MKYDESTIKTLTEAIQNGDTDEIACKKANINTATFYRWLKDPEKSDFCEAIKNAREEFKLNIVSQIEHSLWDRARGFDYEERHTKFGTDPKSGKVIVKERLTKEIHVVQETGAIVFALTNLAPEKWKNRQNIEATGANGRDLMPKQSIDLDALTAEQKAAVLAIGEKIINSKDNSKDKDNNKQ